MPLIGVIKAYTTDHYPLNGNLPEEVLVLATGQSVYLNPGDPDEIFETEDEAVQYCAGMATISDNLARAWVGGYRLADSHDEA